MTCKNLLFHRTHLQQHQILSCKHNTLAFSFVWYVHVRQMSGSSAFYFAFVNSASRCEIDDSLFCTFPRCYNNVEIPSYDTLMMNLSSSCPLFSFSISFEIVLILRHKNYHKPKTNVTWSYLQSAIKQTNINFLLNYNQYSWLLVLTCFITDYCNLH